MYDLIVRHFLAQNSKDAEGEETEVQLVFGDQLFTKKGILVKAKNFLEIYPFFKWVDSELPVFTLNDVITPNECLLEESITTAPKPITESELISLMEKNKIGTDATIHEHIKKIKDRKFIFADRAFLRSTNLGKGLLKSYESMGLQEIYLPSLRSNLEVDLTSIARGNANKNEILKKYRDKLL